MECDVLNGRGTTFAGLFVVVDLKIYDIERILNLVANSRISEDAGDAFH